MRKICKIISGIFCCLPKKFFFSVFSSKQHHIDAKLPWTATLQGYARPRWGQRALNSYGASAGHEIVTME